MKAKLLGIFICLLILQPIFSGAKPQETQIISDTPRDRLLIFSDVYPPLWKIGDYWTYSIDLISINFEQDNQTIDILLERAELHLKVIDDGGEQYTLECETSISGNSDINVDLGDGPINLTVTFSSVAIHGSITLDKTNLGIQRMSLSLKDRFMVTIHNQPYIQLPAFLSSIPVPVTMSLITEFENPFSFLSFPFNTNSSWDLTATNFSIAGKLQSIWLHILHFVNKIANMFGYELLPNEIAELLPVVDIEKALIMLELGNEFFIPEVPSAFTCFSTEDIVVPAGIYHCYNISVIGEFAHCYYAPSAGNIIRISGNFEEVVPYVKDFNMQLIDTNYI